MSFRAPRGSFEPDALENPSAPLRSVGVTSGRPCACVSCVMPKVQLSAAPLAGVWRVEDRSTRQVPGNARAAALWSGRSRRSPQLSEGWGLPDSQQARALCRMNRAQPTTPRQRCRLHRVVSWHQIKYCYRFIIASMDLLNIALASSILGGVTFGNNMSVKVSSPLNSSPEAPVRAPFKLMALDPFFWFL